jgi:Uma2 family endonuclease
MDTLIKDIIKSPKLGIYYKEIEDIIVEERKKRLKFYEDMKDGDKVEFINGDVIFNSPVKLEHNQCAKLLVKLLDTYAQLNNLGFVGFEKIMISLTRNDYEPDICYFNKSKSQKFNSKQMQFPAPDFVAEIISPSTENTDRVIKFEDYAAHGVNEYWIIDPEKRTIEQYLCNNNLYELNLKSGSGLIRSKEIKGFEIPIESIFNEEENLKTLKKIIN